MRGGDHHLTDGNVAFTLATEDEDHGPDAEQKLTPHKYHDRGPGSTKNDELAIHAEHTNGDKQDEHGQHDGHQYMILILSRKGEGDIPISEGVLTIAQQHTITDLENVDHNWREELIEALLTRQRDDGSWINEADRWMEGEPVLTTTYALLTLEEILKPILQLEDDALIDE